MARAAASRTHRGRVDQAVTVSLNVEQARLLDGVLLAEQKRQHATGSPDDEFIEVSAKVRRMLRGEEPDPASLADSDDHEAWSRRLRGLDEPTEEVP